MHWPRWLYRPTSSYWLCWGLGGLYNLLRDVFAGPPLPLLVFNASHFGVWALLGLVALPLIERHPLRWHPAPIAFHLALGALLAQIDVTLGHWLFMRLLGIHPELDLAQIAKIAYVDCFHLALLTYFVFLAIVHARGLQRRASASEHREVELRRTMLAAQLQALRQQLQPHFLFNTLHSVNAWIAVEPKTAQQMLQRLSELLRLSLRECDDATVPLARELELLRAYLDIEQLRFERRLEVSWSVDAELLDERVPPFLLQPLAENAIKHGIAPHAEGGRIAIRAFRADGQLRLEVENSAAARSSVEAAAGRPGFGIGLRNTHARLAALYGAAPRFELVRAGLATIARINLPAVAA